jgi:hypothetical protein
MSEMCNKFVNTEKYGSLYLRIIFILTVQKRFLLSEHLFCAVSLTKSPRMPSSSDPGIIFTHICSAIPFSTNTSRSGIPLLNLKFLMGHSDTRMLEQVYTNYEDLHTIHKYKENLDTVAKIPQYRIYHI